LDFDLDQARAQNDENPAYYVQYAHARISSVLRFAAERGLDPQPGGGIPLRQAEEVALVRKLATFPEVVRGAAVAREPHRIPVFLMETAAEFHRFYHGCRVVSDEVALSRARLLLCAATRTVLRNGLDLMGVTAPERMDRAAEAGAGAARSPFWAGSRGTASARRSGKWSRGWAARRRTSRSRPATSRPSRWWPWWARTSRASIGRPSSATASTCPASRPRRDARSAGAAS